MQATVRQLVRFAGVGLHTGRYVQVVIHPAEEDYGIQFMRGDLRRPPKSTLIPARWEHVVDTSLATTLGLNGSRSPSSTVTMVEHLLAALSGSGVDNAVVEVTGPELPILDGSAMPWMEELRGNVERQSRPRSRIEVLKEITVREGYSVVSLHPPEEPNEDLFVDVEIDFGRRIGGKAGGQQKFRCERREIFTEIAKARTFGFLDELARMRATGRAIGGSLKNAVLFRHGLPVNPEGLRFEDEPVRHKVLDMFGDLSLGGRLNATCVASRPGHRANLLLLKLLYSDPSNYREVCHAR